MVDHVIQYFGHANEFLRTDSIKQDVKIRNIKIISNVCLLALKYFWFLYVVYALLHVIISYINIIYLPKRVAASGCVGATLSCSFLWCIGTRCNCTRNAKLASCIKLFAYWSSEMQFNIKKHNFTLSIIASVLVPCMTIELENKIIDYKICSCELLVHLNKQFLWIKCNIEQFSLE